MRIGIDCRIYGPSHGYMGKYIQNLVSYLEQNEDTNEYVLFFGEREFSEFVPKSSRFRAVRTTEKIGSIGEQLFFPFALYAQKLDSMLFSCPYSPVLYFKQTIIILSDMVAYFYPEKHLKGSVMRHWHTFLLRNSIRKAHSIIALSETLRRDIIEIFDTHEEKIQVIPPMGLGAPGSDMSGENGLKQFLLQEGIDAKYMLFVWDLKEYRNIPRLLEAYHLLLEEDETVPDLVLVGKEDPTYHRIRSTLIQLKLQSRVHIYNVLDEEKIGLLYQNALLYILPSLYEGSEEAVLAPLAHGLPIVASSLPSIAAALPRDEALFFRPMSVLEMKEALKKAFLNPLAPRETRDMSVYSASSVSRKLLDVLSQQREESGVETEPYLPKKVNL